MAVVLKLLVFPVPVPYVSAVQLPIAVLAASSAVSASSSLAAAAE